MDTRSLKEVLLDYQQRFVRNIHADDEVKLESKNHFVTELKLVSGRNRIFLWINIGMLLAVFIGSIAFIVYYIDNLKAVAVISGVSGISLAGMIYYMTYLWKQIVAIDLAIAFADRMDPGVLPGIVNSMLTTVGKPVPVH